MADDRDRTLRELFDITGRVAVITGGGGMLGRRHAEVVAEQGGIPVLLDAANDLAAEAATAVESSFGGKAMAVRADVTSRDEVVRARDEILGAFGRIDILVNNAAMTVKGVAGDRDRYFAPFESYDVDLWERALRVNLTGAFVCCQVFGEPMLAQGSGVVLNIGSDVGIVSPDHRIYEGIVSPHNGKPFNTPLSYSVSKAGLIQMTRYLATYWAGRGIRVNALSPAGVFDGHEDEFVSRLSSLIPLGRMARKDEYKGAVAFLISDASSFMTGSNLVVDGGRTAW